MSRLSEVDLSQSLSKKEEGKRLAAAQTRLQQLRLTLGGQIGERGIGPAVCIVFEGWDAGGKGGAIKRLVAELDSRHVRVVQFEAPTHDEKRHQFLWRFWPVLPGKGGMSILDRSWYGRVLVERVEGFATREEWLRAYDEINDFERSLTEDGTILIKFWLHVSDEEQLHRFERRERKPLKAWKLTEEDWRNREKRAEYEEAVEDMLARTDQPHAPWDLIAGDSKQFARVSVIETVIRRIEEGMERFGIPGPGAASEGLKAAWWRVARCPWALVRLAPTRSPRAGRSRGAARRSVRTSRLLRQRGLDDSVGLDAQAQSFAVLAGCWVEA